MKKLIVTLFALFMILSASPAKAAVDCVATPKKCRCVAVVFHRPALSPPDDLEVVIVKWGQVRRLANRMINRVGRKKKRVAAVHFFYDQFGLQGGPTVEKMENQEMGLSFIDPTVVEPRDGLYWPVFSSGNNPAQHQAFRDWFFAALDDTEDVTLIDEEVLGSAAPRVLSGTDVVLLEGVANTQVALDGVALAQSIKADIDANGC